QADRVGHCQRRKQQRTQPPRPVRKDRFRGRGSQHEAYEGWRTWPLQAAYQTLLARDRNPRRARIGNQERIMGRKVHPVGFRLKINHPWEARWFAEGTRYQENLHEDFRIRQFINSETDRAGISKIEIERYPSLVEVTIFTAKPGIVIGRKGEAVKKIRQGLETLTQKKIKIEVEEIQKPDLDAKLVADNIAGQLERRIGHSRAMNPA